MSESSAPSVYGAWSKVMEDVQGIGKDGVNTTPGQNYRFRGIDAVMNAVGPALRAHGVVVVPRVLSETSERYESKNGAKMVNRIVEVEYTVYGPNGDHFSGASYGEAADSGDKGITKAQSVAYRTFLLQGLTIPTDEPDPDASTHERGSHDRRHQEAQPSISLADVKAASDRAGASREDVEKYFSDKHKCEIANASPKALRDAVDHFTAQAVKKELSQ
ncbi:MAG: hypothetical protein A4E20_11010 [Nitrospira sp. SG-bin2]|uniref:ERF family protein n=1 Tax=Nitrospira cf. moscoviensis SBR1015 TaxID=96242 RepID=UPI000A0D749F|nr:ERF family protein [Nitrospira cf. moscoviensis SBR1015]OQW34542.1 MAG: hypothetical protein A4E20_11010 [Nitrospira sp. SG-bin2]